jgi:hypothetical protein
MAAIQFHVDQAGEAPTRREITAYLNTYNDQGSIVSSQSGGSVRRRLGVEKRIESLVEKGFLEKTDRRSRNLNIRRRIQAGHPSDVS